MRQTLQLMILCMGCLCTAYSQNEQEKKGGFVYLELHATSGLPDHKGTIRPPEGLRIISVRAAVPGGAIEDPKDWSLVHLKAQTEAGTPCSWLERMGLRMREVKVAGVTELQMSGMLLVPEEAKSLDFQLFNARREGVEIPGSATGATWAQPGEASGTILAARLLDKLTYEDEGYELENPEGRFLAVTINGYQVRGDKVSAPGFRLGWVEYRLDGGYVPIIDSGKPDGSIDDTTHYAHERTGIWTAFVRVGKTLPKELSLVYGGIVLDKQALKNIPGTYQLPRKTKRR